MYMHNMIKHFLKKKLGNQTFDDDDENDDGDDDDL